MSRLSLLVAFVAVALAGCEEGVIDPPDIEAAYTLWGAFDPTGDVQAVRVVPITDTVGLGSAAPLPVTVTSVDLETGAEQAWRDSVVTYANGSIGHVYLSDFRPAYGSRHVFRVADADGETSALVSVPPLIEPIRQEPIVGAGIEYPVLWIDAPRLNRVRAEFLVEDNDCAPYTSSRELELSLVRPVEFGWRVVLPFDDVARELLAESLEATPPGNTEQRALSVRRVRLIVEVASEDWRPPGGVFDPEVLIEPGTLSNVTRGFGFVGAAYEQTIEWTPTPDELARTILRPNRFGCTGTGGG